MTVAYFALAPHSLLRIKSDEREHPQFFHVKKLPKLAFDNKEIIKYALGRLRAKLEYTNVVHSFYLHTSSQCLHCRELTKLSWVKKLDKRNFIKKFLSLGIVNQISKKLSGPRRRSAQLYRFISQKLTELKKFL